MALTTTNGMSIDDLSAAPNGPGLAQQLGNQVDSFYGSSAANAAALPATGKFAGQHVWVADIETHAVWNPTVGAWDGYFKSYTATLTGLAGSVSAMWCRIGKLVTVEFLITASGAATGAILLSKPSTSAVTTGGQIALGTASAVDISASAFRGASVFNQSATQVSFFNVDTNQSLSTTVPWTWAAGDTIGGTFTYREVA